MSAEARDAQRAAEDLGDRFDKLTLVCQALWSLVQEKTGLTEADLLERVQQLDLADGMPDGKTTRKISQCPQCRRTMSPRHARCLYCGYDKLITSAFDTLT